MLYLPLIDKEYYQNLIFIFKFKKEEHASDY